MTTNKEKEYKEDRFEFTVYVNDNIICKRNFKIYDFIEGSMQTIEFKHIIDEIVRMIDEDLKSKSRVYTWHYYNPNSEVGNEEFEVPTIDPWVCTFKFTVTDNKQEIISRIWDGYAYPRNVRERVDLSNKYVKFATKDGKNFSYEKEAFFERNGDRLTFEQEVLKGMIMDKQDLIAPITKLICDTCSLPKGTPKTYPMKKIMNEYLADMSTDLTYGTKKYPLNIKNYNKSLETKLARQLSSKTKAYFDGLY